jgi:hypothetical protein
VWLSKVGFIKKSACAHVTEDLKESERATNEEKIAIDNFTTVAKWKSLHSCSRRLS